MTDEEYARIMVADAQKKKEWDAYVAKDKMRTDAYGKNIYQHQGKNTVAQPLPQGLAQSGMIENERNRRLGKILDTGNVYEGNMNPYQKHGININNRTGNFLSSVVNRLF